jgi:DNA (cytosine-5)-methyltransferase 1
MASQGISEDPEQALSEKEGRMRELPPGTAADPSASLPAANHEALPPEGEAVSRARALSLFAGIGGFDLGFERAGIRTTRQIERDADCQAVLRRNFPSARLDGDVTTAQYEEGEADVICAGFPCQDISQAGSRAGLAGSRSGLFWEVVRAVRVVRPRHLVLENVAALRRRGLGTVLGALAESGFDAEWDCIPKSHVGAPDIRDRLWLIAEPQHSDADRQRSHPAPVNQHGTAQLFDQQERVTGPMGAPLAAALARVGPAGGRAWDAEPQLPRVADGLPSDVAAVKQFGNALCPRISEAIGLAIFASASAERAAA